MTFASLTGWTVQPGGGVRRRPVFPTGIPTRGGSRVIGGRSGQSRESSDPARRASRYDGTKIVDAEYEDLDGKDGGE